MARIAYIDHSFHRTTRSTEFLPELLRRYGHTVDLFWDEAWQGGQPVAWDSVVGHDVVVMFQSHCPVLPQPFRRSHPNVIYIPMLDQFSFRRGPLLNLSAFWEAFQGSKVLNFSYAIHCMTLAFGIASHHTRYFPPVAALPHSRGDGLHGFFWFRRPAQLPWSVIRKLISGVRFDSFHIHLAADPGSPPFDGPTTEDIERHGITMSTWFEDRADLEKVMARANIYFAPRLEEGIGQSFLESMARGQCVVAPDYGTMNEYIISGENGLLYDPAHPAPLDFSDALQMGANGRRSVMSGRAAWERAEGRLVEFILAPSASYYEGMYQHPALYDLPNEAAREATSDAGMELPSVRLALQALAARVGFLRATRFIWRPLLRLARGARAIR
jgi:hypothetical protein